MLWPEAGLNCRQSAFQDEGRQSRTGYDGLSILLREP
jgi:hypothetical protein